MYHSRAFPCVSKIKYRLWKRQLFSFSSMSKKPHIRLSRSTYGMVMLSHITGKHRWTDRHCSQLHMEAKEGHSHIRQTRRINHHTLMSQTHTCICAEREEERDQLILSSFSCDTIEAEQQTLKPEAERRPPPQPKITDCAQDLHTRTFPLVGEERRRRGTCMRITQPLSPYPGLRWGGGTDQRDSR